VTEPTSWTLEGIRALRDADGLEPAHREGFATADPGRSLQWIRLTFESGHQRAWECKHLGPWVEVPGLSGTPEALPVDYIVLGRHVVGREDGDD
jgi:hypothetical protein